MKNLILLSLFFIMISSTCKKKQPADFLPGTWGVLTFKEDGTDKTTEFLVTYQAYQITFDAKGNYGITYRLSGKDIAIDGTWTLENNNQMLTLVDNNPNSSKKIKTYTIDGAITETTLKLLDDNKEYEFKKL